MDAAQIHVCPRCPLRFVNQTELEDHLDRDHGLDLRKPSSFLAGAPGGAASSPAPSPPAGSTASRQEGTRRNGGSEAGLTAADPRPAAPAWGTLTVPLDPTREPPLALDVAVAFARQAGMALDFVAVPPRGLPPVTTESYLSARMRAVLSAPDAPPGSRHVLGTGDAAEAIATHVAGGDTTLLCMATHARGPFSEMVLGSVSEAVLRSATVPVLLVGPHVRTVPTRYQRIVVALDASEQSEHALDVVADLDRHLGAGLFLVEVLDPGRIPAGVDVHETAYLHRVASRLPGASIGYDTLHGRDAARAIVDAAAQGPDGLLAMGTHGRTGVRRLALGSVALDVVRHAPCPVLVVPPPTA